LAEYPLGSSAHHATFLFLSGSGGRPNMGIQVECPNGHTFKVKDKYAGKKGLCPHCEGQVIVQVPDALTANPASDTLQREAIQRRQAAQHQASPRQSTKQSAS